MLALSHMIYLSVHLCDGRSGRLHVPRDGFISTPEILVKAQELFDQGFDDVVVSPPGYCHGEHPPIAAFSRRRRGGDVNVAYIS